MPLRPTMRRLILGTASSSESEPTRADESMIDDAEREEASAELLSTARSAAAAPRRHRAQQRGGAVGRRADGCSSESGGRLG